MQELNDLGLGNGFFMLMGSFVLLGLVSLCFIYQKAGEKWWSALIPFYSAFIQFRIARDGRFFAFMGLYVAAVVLSACGIGFLTFVAFCFNVYCVVVGITVLNKMVKRFGRNRWFTAGLIFFPYVNYLRWAFDKRIQLVD